MTEELNSGRDEQAADQIAQADWFLQMLVSSVNSSKGTLGVTLQVSGMLVSGQMVSVVDYFEGFADTYASANADPSAGQAASQPFRDLAQHTQAVREADAENLPPPTYIHLKNTHFFQPGSSEPIPGNNVNGVFWRGRISEVHGFILGTVGPRSE